ncbi:MAG: hypothetical protein LBM92_01770 [Opitutaceae bacterium]|jgi:hypothetical protein|nr:hypothetical protein [Opitutaceae bacterium]
MPAPVAAEPGALPNERRVLDPSAMPVIAIDRSLPGGNAAQSRRDGRGASATQHAAVEQLLAHNWLLGSVRQREAEVELRRRALVAGALSPDDTASAMKDWTEAEMKTWLLTGQLPEVREPSTASRDPAPASAGGAGKTTRANATSEEAGVFSAYLASWLTPADYALLNSKAGGVPASAGGVAPSRNDAGAPASAPENAAGAPSAGAPLAAGGPDAGILTPSATPATAGNPFVEDVFSPILATPAPSMVNQLPVPAQEPAQQNAAGPAHPAPENKALKPAGASAPPAEPIINDKKYFPQLNRF